MSGLGGLDHNGKLNKALDWPSNRPGNLSITGNARVGAERPGVNAAGDVADVLKAVVEQKRSHAHAACAMVAQAGDGVVWVQLLQTAGDVVHGNAAQLEALADLRVSLG